jgi:hypothetical protein
MKYSKSTTQFHNNKVKVIALFAIIMNSDNHGCPEGVLGCSPPGKFRREKYQRGDQGKI